jgi:hypothetical protein
MAVMSYSSLVQELFQVGTPIENSIQEWGTISLLVSQLPVFSKNELKEAKP